jgi:hypothetical protein
MHDAIKWSLFVFGILVLLVILLIILIITDFAESCSCDINESSRKYLNNKNISDIVVTFTTMPQRLKSATFKKCVSSILTQSLRAQEIRINIPYILKKTGENYIIPEWLSKTPVIIVRPEDEGPATKYLETLRHYKDTKQKILVYDDDSILPPNTILKYDKFMKEYPNTVIATFGTLLNRKKNKNGETVAVTDSEDKAIQFAGKYHMCTHFCYKHLQKVMKSDKIQKVDFIYGVNGYCLVADMVDVNVLSDFKSMPKSAFFVDDIVMSGHLASRNIPRVVGYDLECTRMTYENIFGVLKHYFDGSNKETLSLTANSSNKNNATMIEYFSPHWWIHD